MGTQHLFLRSKNICLCSLFVQISSLDSHFLWFQKQKNLYTPLFQKKNFCMIPSCSPVLLWTLFYSTFFSFIHFLNHFVKTGYSFFVHLLFLFSCISLFFSVFSLPFVLPFCCLHTFCEHRLVRIAFFQVRLFLVFSAPCFDLSFFLRNDHRCLSSFISFFSGPLSRSSFFFSFHKTFLSFSFRSFVCFFLNKNYLFVLHCCIFHFDHFVDTIFCSLSQFSSFVFASYSLFVFHMSFSCLCFFFSVPFSRSCSLFSFFSFSFSICFLFLFDITLFDSLSLFSAAFSLSLLLSLILTWFVCSSWMFSLFVFFISFFHNFDFVLYVFFFLVVTFCLVPFVLPEKLVNGKTTANAWTSNGLSQNGCGGGKEEEGERGGSRGFQWPPAERAQAWCQRCGTNRCGDVFVLIWTRGKVVELGTCIPAETVKACALIGLHMMADENALRTVTLLLSWEMCESMAARKALFGPAVVMSAQEVTARLLLRIMSTTSITSVLKPFFLSTWTAVTFEERDVLGEMEWQWIVWMSWTVRSFDFCYSLNMVRLLVFVYSSECWKEALPPLGSFVATNGRMVFLTFDVCTWERDTEFVCGASLSSVGQSDWHL